MYIKNKRFITGENNKNNNIVEGEKKRTITGKVYKEKDINDNKKLDKYSIDIPTQKERGAF